MNIRLASRGRRHISLFQQAGSLFPLAFSFLPAACLLVEIAQRHHALVFRALARVCDGFGTDFGIWERAFIMLQCAQMGQSAL